MAATPATDPDNESTRAGATVGVAFSALDAAVGPVGAPTSTSRPSVQVPDWVRGRHAPGSPLARRAVAFILAGAVLVAWLAFLRTWLLTAPPAPPDEVVAETIPDPGPRPVLALEYAGINYMNGGPADSVIEVKVIVVNGGDRHSDSTSIRWEPSFARDYTFLKSEPSPWRVRVDEWGWGVYDGPGVLPTSDGTYLLWFTRTGFTVDEPRVQVIGNGTIFLGDTFAIAMNRILNREPPLQAMFERAPVAPVVDRIGRLVPDVIETAPFGFALGLAGTLTALVAGGIVAALRRPPEPSHVAPRGAARA